MARNQPKPDTTNPLLADVGRVLDQADPVPAGLADRVGSAIDQDTAGGGDR